MFMCESLPPPKKTPEKNRWKFWQVRCPPKQRSQEVWINLCHVLWRYPKRWFTIRESSQHPHNICVGEYDGISTHINTNFRIKHPVFLQLKWCRLYDPPKTCWILCRFQAHLRITKRHFSQGLDLEDCLARSKTSLGSTRNYSQDHREHVISTTPEPFVTAGSKSKMSSFKLFNPIYCRDFSRTMSPFCFNVYNWCAEYLGFSAIRTTVFTFQAISNLFGFLLSIKEWPTQISDHLQIHYVPSLLNICKGKF